MIRVLLTICATITLLCGSACSQPASSVWPAVGESTRRDDFNRTSAAKSTESTLYVLNLDFKNRSGGIAVTVLPAYGKAFARNISLGDKGLYDSGMATSSHGFLYTYNGSVDEQKDDDYVLNEYESRGSKLVRTLYQVRRFGAIAVDPSDNLYTVCNDYFVCEYKDGRQQITRQLPVHKSVNTVSSIASDSSGDVAIMTIKGTATVAVFAPGSVKSYWRITNISYPSIYHRSMAFDSSGNLYVISNLSVEVYAPGKNLPSRTITKDVTQPQDIAIDGSDNLYVLNPCFNERGPCQNPATIVVYRAGENKPARKITDGLVANNAEMIATNSEGYLALTNGGSVSAYGNVVVYGPNASHPLRTITANIENPWDISFGE